MDMTVKSSIKLQDLIDYLDDTGAEWEVSPEEATFTLLTIRLHALEVAINRPLLLSDVLMDMVGQTRSEGPIILDTDYSVIDGMCRLADMLQDKNKDSLIQAYVRVKKETKCNDLHETECAILIKGLRQFMEGKRRIRPVEVTKLNAVEITEFKRIMTNQLPHIKRDRWRLVVAMRFGLLDYEEQTRKEVAAALGVTSNRVQQLERKALRLIGEKTPDWPKWLHAKSWS